MVKRIMISLSVLFLIVGIVREGLARTKLPDHHKKWVEEEVVYIITPKEKDVFMKLETDKEREIFIEAFWKQRDPSSGTPRNEFKEEHYRRWGYANEFFSRGTPRPGWKTDMGRIYIVLGPPTSIEYHENVMNVFPTQVWSYLGDPKYGLPTAFNIVFFKKDGIGEYILYSPSDHGPQSLIADYMGDARNVQDAYQRLQKLAPSLAKSTLSLIPGERGVPGLISLASNRLFSAVFSYPEKKVEDSYAEAILKFKDFVEVEYTANYIRSDAMVKVLMHDAGYFLVHYAVEPKKISVDRIGDRYTAHFELDGRVTDLSGRTVFQYTKEIPLSLTEAQMQGLESTSLALQDMFPLVPGHYKFDLLVKNTVSKEFTSLEGEVLIPRDFSIPQMSSLILGYRVEKSPTASKEIVPFKMGESQILCQSRKTFTKKDSLYIFFQIFGLDENAKSQGELRFTFLKDDQEFLSLTRKISDFQSRTGFFQEQSLSEFVPGYYRIRVSLLNGEGKEVLFEAEDFEITFASDLPRPLVISKVMPSSQVEEYDFIRGGQFLNTGDIQKAEDLLERAYRKSPQRLDYALVYAQALFIAQRYQDVKEILVPYLDSPDESDGVLYFLGKATHALGEFQDALSLYQKYISRFGTNIEILNLMGTCLFKLGDREEAIAIWERSLEINPDQSEIKTLVESLKKEE
jgi:GWxTD domain-containing protein